MADLLIINGILITMDPDRRVIENGAIAVQGDRIIDVGLSKDILTIHHAPKIIDASRMAVMPGLIDGHGHAGHALVGNIGADQSTAWRYACEKIYSEGSTEEFWYIEALLSALQRLKFGTTCAMIYFGGGPDVMRTDDPVYGDRHCEAISQVGTRSFVAVGPWRPPFPRKYSQWHGQSRRDIMVSFDDQMATCETLIDRWHRKLNERIHICLSFPVYHQADSSSEQRLSDLKQQARTVRGLSRKHQVLFTQDGHVKGSLKFAHEQFDLLGPDALMAHSIDLTAEEIELCRTTDTRIVHNPSSPMSDRGRCPVPELLDAGVCVALGSDGTAPNTSFDMFRHMFHCMHYHRTYYRDTNYLPPGKVLEMVTIDAARALGMEKEIGSLEVGKKADIILVDMFKPHLVPLQMPVYRVLYFANGNDVDTVIVDGRVLMEKRVVKTVDENEILEMGLREAEAMLDRTQLRDLLKTPETFWKHTRYGG